MVAGRWGEIMTHDCNAKNQSTDGYKVWIHCDLFFWYFSGVECKANFQILYCPFCGIDLAVYDSGPTASD